MKSKRSRDEIEYLTTREVGRRLKVGRAKVLGWIRRGELRAVNVAATTTGRPQFVVAVADLERFEAKRTVLSPDVPVRKNPARLTGVKRYY